MKEDIEALFDKHFKHDPANPHVGGEKQCEMEKSAGEDFEAHGYLKQVYYALEEK